MFLFKKKRRFYCGHKSFWVGYTTEIIKRKTYDGYNIQEKEDVKFYLKTSQNNESEYSMITRVFKNGIILLKKNHNISLKKFESIDNVNGIMLPFVEEVEPQIVMFWQNNDDEYFGPSYNDGTYNKTQSLLFDDYIEAIPC